MNAVDVYKIVLQRRMFNPPTYAHNMYWIGSRAAYHELSETHFYRLTKEYASSLYGYDWWLYATEEEADVVMYYCLEEVKKGQGKATEQIKRRCPHILPLNPKVHTCTKAHKTGLKGKFTEWLGKKRNAKGEWQVFWENRKPYIAFEDANTAFFFKMTHC